MQEVEEFDERDMRGELDIEPDERKELLRDKGGS